MNLSLLTHSPNASALACGAMLAAGLFTVSARADEWNKKTVLTVNQPIQITDTYLEPGQYVLKLLDSPSDRHVVQIFNGDGSRIINTVLAIPTYRINPSGHSQFTFWETPPGTAKALRDWYYPGDNFGNEFTYPKQPRQLAILSPPVPVTSAYSEETTTTPTPVAPPTVDNNTQIEQPMDNGVAEQAPPTPPADEAAAPPPPADTPAAPPTELPKTGSPYPLIGICGIGLAGLAGALLLKRPA